MTQSLTIRDAAYDLLNSTPRFSAFTTKRKVGMPPLEKDDLPALSVFILEEERTPFGDSNVGTIKFYTDTTIAFSVTRGFEVTVPADLEPTISADVDAIEQALLTNATFTRFGANALFESIEKTHKRWIFPEEADTYYVILQLEITFRYQEWFYPTITDDLKVVHVDGSFPQGEDTTRVQQVHAEYDIPTS